MTVNMPAALAEARKALVAVVGALGQALALGLLHGSAEHYASVAIAVATALGVHVVPNAAPAPVDSPVGP